MPEIDYTPYPNIRPSVAAPDGSCCLSVSDIRGLKVGKEGGVDDLGLNVIKYN